VLGSAKSLNADNHVLNLLDYTLVKGGKTGHAYNGSVELVDWMKGVRNRDPNKPQNATFFFPENNTGPDLIFALHSRSSPNQGAILCLLQAS
jgi:hypothetical protein